VIRIANSKDTGRGSFRRFIREGSVPIHARAFSSPAVRISRTEPEKPESVTESNRTTTIDTPTGAPGRFIGTVLMDVVLFIESILRFAATANYAVIGAVVGAVRGSGLRCII